MRLVLDTNVVASGLLWDGTPRVLLTAGRERRVALFTSPTLIRELADILLRKKFEAVHDRERPSRSCSRPPAYRYDAVRKL